ncbi:MAG TPA: hypothetical protein VM683_14920 [Anaeromyxobacteraceae bacterium]|nr:hypothetical protein [Anaeromyxobacteraceae bacterium]
MLVQRGRRYRHNEAALAELAELAATRLAHVEALAGREVVWVHRLEPGPGSSPPNTLTPGR